MRRLPDDILARNADPVTLRELADPRGWRARLRRQVDLHNAGLGAAILTGQVPAIAAEPGPVPPTPAGWLFPHTEEPRTRVVLLDRLEETHDRRADPRHP